MYNSIKIPFEISINNNAYIGNANLFQSYAVGKKEMHKKYSKINIKCKLIGISDYKIYLVCSDSMEYEYFSVLNY